MNREQRRAAKFKRARRWNRNDNQPLGQVHIATIRAKLTAELQRLTRSAGLHAYTGHDHDKLVNDSGRLIYITAFACGAMEVGDTPDTRILRGASEALGDIVACPAELERQRGAIISGLAAAARLMPDLPDWALGAGLVHLEQLLASTAGMGTADVRAALEGVTT